MAFARLVSGEFRRTDLYGNDFGKTTNGREERASKILKQPPEKTQIRPRPGVKKPNI